MMRFSYHDGGRADAGFRGSAGDCVTRAIAIAVGKPYREVYDELNRLGAAEREQKNKRRSSSRNGVHRTTYQQYLEALGWKWKPTMAFGSGCTVHLCDSELPKGRLIVRLSKHVAAVVDGVLYDTQDCSRCGSRCVYGYFSRNL